MQLNPNGCTLTYIPPEIDTTNANSNANLANATISHLLALGLYLDSNANVGIRVGSARLFRNQNVGIGMIQMEDRLYYLHGSVLNNIVKGSHQEKEVMIIVYCFIFSMRD